MAEKRDVNTPAASGEGAIKRPTRPAAERPATPNDPSDIEAWRRRIDIIDEQLMRLLNSRSACAVEIGKVKRALGLPVYSPEREAWILGRVMRENPGPLDPMAVKRVFERIIDESRRLERMAVDRAEMAVDQEGNPVAGKPGPKRGEPKVR